MMRPTLSPLLCLALMACGGTGETGPGGVTPDEARELNEAAAMLDTDSVSSNALTDEATAR